ncbi:YdbH domain-containing protein [Pontibacterium granulatum]|uniref:YdbH domain-containing protein n=1 Tax=Pontibacterium granulatum TaxID=2036029 RepID=UPI00249CB509|nr:YdbH domain-containing protein [Pontibacterium granulatum]MDI3324126.1 YdbH domain-containing protein [Pontibacterium granulatum]
MRRLYISLAILILLPVLLVVALYAATPYIVQWGGSRWLAEQNFQNVVLDMERPGWNRLTVKRFMADIETETAHVSVSAGPLTIEYTPLTLWASQKVDLVELPQSSIRIQITGSSQDESTQPDVYLNLPELLPAAWFVLLPSKQIRVGEMNLLVDYPESQSDWTLSGAFLIDDKQFYSRVRFKRDEQDLGWSDLELTPENHFNFRLLQEDSPFVVIDGNLRAEKNVSLHANQVIDLGGLRAWLDRFMPTLSLPAASGSVSTRGTFVLPLKAALSPEGMLSQLVANHSYTTQSTVTGISDELPALALNAAGQLELAAGNLALKVAQKSSVKAAPVVLPNIRLANVDLVLDRPINVSVNLNGMTRANTPPVPTLDNLPIRGQLHLTSIQRGDIRAAISPIQFSVDSADLVQHLYKGTLELPEVAVTLPDHKVPNLALKTQFSISPGEATTRFTLLTKGLPIKVNGTTATSLKKGRTDLTWTLASVRLAGLDDTLRPYAKQIPPELSLLDGRFDHNGVGSVQNGKLSLTFWNAVNGADAAWGKTVLRGIGWQSSSRYSASGAFSDKGALTVGSLFGGVEIDNISTRYSFRQTPKGTRTVSVAPVSAEMLGGDIRVDGFKTALQSPDISTSVTVEQLDVAKILELEQQKGLSGSGQMSGRFPFRYNAEGASVNDGRLTAPEGGVIRFQPDAAVAAYAATNPALGMALGALENFQYDTLDIKLNYQPDGTALLNTRLKGRNPDWNNGHPVDFTINVEENIPDLVRTLQFADQLTEKLEKRYGD